MDDGLPEIRHDQPEARQRDRLTSEATKEGMIGEEDVVLVAMRDGFGIRGAPRRGPRDNVLLARVGGGRAPRGVVTVVQC